MLSTERAGERKDLKTGGREHVVQEIEAPGSMPQAAAQIGSRPRGPLSLESSALQRLSVAAFLDHL